MLWDVFWKGGVREKARDASFMLWSGAASLSLSQDLDDVKRRLSRRGQWDDWQAIGGDFQAAFAWERAEHDRKAG